jgi:DHA2 family multidrug resistance protein
VPKEQDADAAALYNMFRNLAGSIGISISTALVTTRSEVRQAYLSDHLSPLDQGFNATIAHISASLTAQGVAPSSIPAAAMGWVEQTLLAQSAVLAYIDVYGYCAILALAAVPFAFLFSRAKASGGGPVTH